MKKLILCLAILSCAPAIKNLPPDQQAQITTQIYNASIDQIWNAVLTVLENREYSIQSTDKALGTFTTDYVHDQNILAHYRKRIAGRIISLPDNQVKLKLILLLELKSGNHWEKINLTKDFQKEYQRLFSLIAAQLH